MQVNRKLLPLGLILIFGGALLPGNFPAAKPLISYVAIAITLIGLAIVLIAFRKARQS